MRKISFVFLILAALVFAQDYRAKIQGFVTDPSDAAIPGATATLKNTQTGVESKRSSNEQGHFIFDFVEPGQYELRATAKGFAGFLQKNITVQMRGDITVSARLEIGKLGDSITVSETVATVQFNTASMDHTINGKMLESLPVLSRNPNFLSLLDPLVTTKNYADPSQDTPEGLAYPVAISIGGANKVSSDTNDVQLDGSSSQVGRKNSYTPPMDAVQEYTVVMNGVDAEFGHSSGGIITMAMKTGTNEIHGTVYYFGRNPVVNAASNGLTHSPSPSRNHVWGITAGAPIRKNKLFTFTAYEGTRANSPVSRYFTLPTPSERTGDFSQSKNASGGLRTIYDPWTTKLDAAGAVTRLPFPGNRISSDRLDPTAVRFAKDLWDPNRAGDDVTGANNYRADATNNFKYYNFSERVDYNISDKWKAFGRYSTFRNSNLMKDYVESLAEPDSGAGGKFARNISGDAVYIMSASTILNFRASYSLINDKYYRSDRLTRKEEDLAQFWPNQWYKPYTKDIPVLYYPQLNFPNSTSFGQGRFYWQQPHTFNGQAKFSKSQGGHYWKAGVEYRRFIGDAVRPDPMSFTFAPDITANTYISPNTKLSGDAYATFLLGALNSNSYARSIPLQYPRFNYWGAYFQDDIKVHRRLTLNLGVRWEYNGSIYDSQNRLSRYLDLTSPIPEFQANPPQMPSAVTAIRQTTPVYNGAWVFTDSSHPGMWDAAKNSFLPRIGIAFRINDKTALRAGWSRYLVPSTLLVDLLGSLPYPGFDANSNPLAPLTGVPQAVLGNPFPASNNPLVLPVGKDQGRYTNLGAAAAWTKPEIRTQVNDRINVSFQRQLTRDTVVEAVYFTNLGFDIPYTLNLNQVDPKLGYQYGSQLTKSVPNPFYNILPPEKFYGSLRTQQNVSISSLLDLYPQYTGVTQATTPAGFFRMHALKLQARREFKSGLTFLVSYAYMRSSLSQFFNSDDQYAGLFTLQQTADPRHRLNVSGSYLLPFGKGRTYGAHLHPVIEAIVGGWAISPLARYQSGRPLQFGQMQVSGDAKLSNPTPDRWFDATKFAQSPAYTPRTNPWFVGLYGPRFVQIDASLSKTFPIKEKKSVELRMDTFNVTNSIMFADPNLSVTSSTFGRTTSQINLGREMQYTVRLHF